MAITWAGSPGSQWAPSTVYLLNTFITNGGNVYQCAQAGTSAASGSGPFGTISGIGDGSCVWNFVGPDQGNIVAVAPELANINPAAQTLYLNTVVGQLVDPSNWEDTFTADLACIYLAAHLATVGRSRGKGNVTSEGVGQMNRAYANLLMSHPYLGQSSYGIEFRRLVMLTPAALGLVP